MRPPQDYRPHESRKDRERKAKEKEEQRSSNRYQKYHPKRRSYLKPRLRPGFHADPIKQLSLIYNPYQFNWIDNELVFEKNRKKRLTLPNYLTFIHRERFFIFFKKFTKTFSVFPYVFFFKFFLKCSVSILLSSIRKISVFFLGLTQAQINTSDLYTLVQDFFLKKNFSPMKSLYSIIRMMGKYKKRDQIKGFKFLLAGRFTRRDRATYLWKAADRLPLSSRLSPILYYSWPLQLTYSKCVIKLWLCY